MATSKDSSIFSSLGSFLPSCRRFFRQRKQTNDRRDRCRHWEELGVDIMEKITSGLDVKSVASVRSVCKSWHALFNVSGVRTPWKNPWLLLPQSRSLTNMRFYDMFSPGTNIYSISVPKPLRGGEVCGSSKGWLVVARKSELFLLDPLSGVHHKLPPLGKVPSFASTYLDEEAEEQCRAKASMFIGDIELSSANISECVVAAVADLRTLICCRPKDNDWAIFSDPNEHLYNYLAFCDGYLYVGGGTGTLGGETLPLENATTKVAVKSFTIELDQESCDDDDGDVGVINMKLLPDLTRALSGDIHDYANMRVEEGYCVDDYLVESGENDGSLLLVRKYMDDIYIYNSDIASIEHDDQHEGEDGNLEVDEDDGIPMEEQEREVVIELDDTNAINRTREFEVYKMIPCKDGGEDVKSISVRSVGNLGDQGNMFVGRGSAFVHAFEPSCEEGNRIYYLDDEDRNEMPRDTGVFLLGEGKLKQCLPSIDLPQGSNMFWFTPNLPF